MRGIWVDGCIGFMVRLATAGETLRFVALNSFRIWHSHYFMFYAATLPDSFGNPIQLARHFYVLSRLHISRPSAFSGPLMCLPHCC